MSETIDAARVREPAAALTLGIGEQVARDARTRLIAAAGVVVVHSSYPQGSAALSAMSLAEQGFSAAVYSLAVSFPVHAFVLLSFLSLGQRLEAGVPVTKLLRNAVSKLAPAHLFWVVAFLAARALFERSWPTTEQLLTGPLLGTAAAHLYFTPLLLTLTATAVLWRWLAAAPVRAAFGAFGLALGATAVGTELAPDAQWLGALVGAAGMAPIAIAGLAFGKAWKGVAPGPAAARWILFAAGGVVLLSAVTLANAAVNNGATPLPLAPSLWLSRLGLALGIPLLLLAAPYKVPIRLIRLAPYTLGVYFLHPFPIKALQLLEARLPALEGMEAALILPNALTAAAISFGVVALLARTPLRRFVV